MLRLHLPKNWTGGHVTGLVGMLQPGGSFSMTIGSLQLRLKLVSNSALPDRGVFFVDFRGMRSHSKPRTVSCDRNWTGGQVQY